MVSERLAGMDVSHREDFWQETETHVCRSQLRVGHCRYHSDSGLRILSELPVDVLGRGYHLGGGGKATHLPDFLQDLSLE